MVVFADDFLWILQTGEASKGLITAQIPGVAVLPEHEIRHCIDNVLEHLPGVLEFFLRQLALADILKSHHRTDGLSVLPQWMGPVFHRERGTVTAPEHLVVHVVVAVFYIGPIGTALL